MKIDNSVESTGAAIGSDNARQRAPATATDSAASSDSASVKVNISSLSSLGVDSVLANSPVTNPDKIAEIKQAIADGKFTVNADKIASGLIDSVRELLGKNGVSN